MALTAVILAAGRGSRLGQYGADRPKCLIDLDGVPMIDRQLACLRSCGVDDIVVVTGYRADMLQLPGVRTRHNPHWADTNMVETLFCAEADFGDDVIVSYADIVYEPGVLRALIAAPHDISVIVDHGWRRLWEMRFDDPLSDAETLRINEQAEITEIGNPPESFDDIEAQYIGLMRFRGAGIEALHRAKSDMGLITRPWMASRPVEKAYMTDLLMEMILGGECPAAVPIDGGWLEIDTSEDYEKVRALIADEALGQFFDRDVS